MSQPTILSVDSFPAYAGGIAVRVIFGLSYATVAITSTELIEDKFDVVSKGGGIASVGIGLKDLANVISSADGDAQELWAKLRALTEKAEEAVAQVANDNKDQVLDVMRALV